VIGLVLGYIAHPYPHIRIQYHISSIQPAFYQLKDTQIRILATVNVIFRPRGRKCE